MSIRVSDGTSYYQRNSALTLTAFTAMGWGYQVIDRGTNTGQTIFTASRAIGTNADVYLNWEDTTEAMWLGSWDGASTNESSFASRPSLLQWFHWYVVCYGTGANDLVGGWRSPGSSIYVSTSLQLAPNSSGTGDARIGAYGAAAWGNIRLAAYKQYNATLIESEILAESFYYMPVRFANLAACVPIIAGTAALGITDYSANGADFTNNGSLTIEEAPPILWSKRRARPQYKIPTPGTIAWWRA